MIKLQETSYPTITIILFQLFIHQKVLVRNYEKILPNALEELHD